MYLFKIEIVSSDSKTSNSSGSFKSKFSTILISAATSVILSTNFSKFFVLVFLRTITFTILFSY